MPRQGITQLEILSGWKEIAKYLGKGIRTVQRYERQLTLPIRRPAGKPSGSVIAAKAEIDAWINASAVREGFRLSLPAVDCAKTVKELRQQVAALQRLHEEGAQLRGEMRASRAALRASIKLLKESLALATEDSQSSSRLQTFDPKRKVN